MQRKAWRKLLEKQIKERYKNAHNSQEDLTQKLKLSFIS